MFIRGTAFLLSVAGATVPGKQRPGVSMSFVQSELAKLPCRHKLVILDCCYSGLLLKGKAVTRDSGAAPPAEGDDPFVYYLSRPAFVGLSSGLDDEVPNRVAGSVYSVFTDALLAELRDRADTMRPDQAFTFGQLAPRVKDRVTSRLRGVQIPDYDKLVTGGDGDFVFRPQVRRLTPSGASAHRAYSLALQLVQRAWEAGDPKHVGELLKDANRTSWSDEQDLRGFEWYYWQRLSHSERLALAPHAAVVKFIAYRANGKQLITADSKGAIHVWDADTGMDVRSFVPPQGSLFGTLAYSPKGTRIATAVYRVVAGDDGKLKVESEVHIAVPDGGQELLTLKIRGHVMNVAFSPDEKRLATVSVEDVLAGDVKAKVRLWEVATGKELFARSVMGVPAVAFRPTDSPEEGALAVATGTEAGRGQVQIWDIAGKDVRIVGDVFGMITTFAFDPNGQSLLTACSVGGKTSIVGELTLWDIESGKARWTTHGHRAEITDLAFDSEGDRFVTASYDKSLIVWKARNGTELFTLRGHAHPVMRVAFRPNRPEIASATWGRSPPAPSVAGINRKTLIEKTGRTDDPAEVKLWDVTDATEAVEVPSWGSPVSALAFQPDSKQLAVGYMRGPAGEVTVWDARTAQQVRLPKTDGAEASYHRRDGKTLWDSKAGRRLGILAHDLPVTAVAYSPDGKRLAVGEGKASEPGKAGGVRLWNADTGEGERRLPVECGGVFGVAFHPKGNEIAAGCWDVTTPMAAPPGEPKPWLLNLYPFLTAARAQGQVRRWRLSDGVEVERISESGPVTAVAYCRSGDGFAWATWRLNVIPNEEVNVTGLLKVRGWPGLAISADGSQIATAGSNGAAMIWNRRSEEQPLILRGHADTVTAVAFSPDGRRIATASEDKTVKIWDAESGYELMTLTGHVNMVTCVAFSPDGCSLASGSYSGHVRIWRAPR